MQSEAFNVTNEVKSGCGSLPVAGLHIRRGRYASIRSRRLHGCTHWRIGITTENL